jgi:hypothetical protein
MSSKVSYAFLGDDNSSSKNASAFPLVTGSSGSEESSFTLSTPAPAAVAYNTTTASITVTTPSGGASPYSYSAALSYDSTDDYTAYVSSITSTTLSLAGLVNGQTVGVIITVTDANGDTARVTAYATVAAAAAGVMTPGAFPASQSLGGGSTTTDIVFNAIGGTSTAPVSYVASIISGPGAVSNTGLTATLTGLIDGETTLVRLRATDSNGSPRTADAYALVSVADSTSALAWKTIRQFNFKEQTPVTFVSGAQTVNLVDENTSETVACTLTYSMGSGSFATMTCGFSEANGWRHQWASTGTGTYVRGPLVIPLGLTLGLDDEVRIIIVGKSLQPASGNSFYFQVTNDGSASEDAAKANGFRLLRNGAASAMYLRAGSASGSIVSNSSTPPCPVAWYDGTVVLTTTLVFPRRGTRAYIEVSGTGSVLSADLGHISTAPSHNAVRGGWASGKKELTLQHMGSNGAGNGLGNQYSEIHSITIQRRTIA